jgi:hypothetical protein
MPEPDPSKQLASEVLQALDEYILARLQAAFRTPIGSEPDPSLDVLKEKARVLRDALARAFRSHQQPT